MPEFKKQALTAIRGVKADYSKRQTYIIGIIFTVAVWARLWRLPVWFNRVHDYDEGAWVMGARLLTQGKSLYSDVFFVHPPLYEYVLAAIYSVFGYSFMYARYLAAILSIATLILWFIVSRRFLNPEQAVFSLALFALDPINVYLGRRAVQEPLGFLLLTVSLFFLAPIINGNQADRRRIAAAGIALGLMVATKYIFLPAVFGIGLGFIALSVVRVSRGENSIFNELLPFTILVSSTVLGFGLITANLWLTIPETYLQQTILIHIGREGTGSFPSILEAIENFDQISSWIKWYHMPMFIAVAALPAVLWRPLFGLINGREIEPSKLFLTTSLLGSLTLCQFLSFLPRYYVAAVPFFSLAAPGYLVTWAELEDVLLGEFLKPVGLCLVIGLFVLLLLPIPFAMHGYDVTWQVTPAGEREAYDRTASYLETQNANVVYASNPTIPALTDGITSPTNYESFASLYLKDQTPEQYAEKLFDKDPDYIILDPWLRAWTGPRNSTNQQFTDAVRDRAELVYTVELENGEQIEVYRTKQTTA